MAVQMQSTGGATRHISVQGGVFSEQVLTLKLLVGRFQEMSELVTCEAMCSSDRRSRRVQRRNSLGSRNEGT
jgi:hypothetical protein